jgi:3-deoxy-7-phosphoheptulonate synthase
MTFTEADPPVLAQQALYKQNYQPPYPDSLALTAIAQQLETIPPVTAVEHVDALQAKLADIALHRAYNPIVITGRCAEPVGDDRTAAKLATAVITEQTIVQQHMPDAIFIHRGRGQNTKPRSSFLEVQPDGSRFVTYMGDAVNGTRLDQRVPDPRRMLAAATQAYKLEQELISQTKEHIPSAHEALLLQYELSFMREHQGKRYLLSADLPWIGERTRVLNGPHIAALREIENPIGVKIGPSATAEEIAGYHRILNPESKPGKIVFMLRLGQAALNDKLDYIREYAPRSVLLYDIHGVTKTADDGTKIRAVDDITKDIEATAIACVCASLDLNGLHLESTVEDRLECVQSPDEKPTHPGGIDPQLNTTQLQQVLASAKHNI